MAIAERKLPTPALQEGPRAKSLRPYERRAVRPVTREVLSAFEAAVLKGDEAAIRLSAGRVMDELLVDAAAGGPLPDDLVAEIDRWREGEFRGTRADVELANWALAVVLNSPVRTGLPAADDELDD